MPTPLVIANCVVVKLNWAQGTRTWLNVLGGQGAAPVTVTQALADTLFSAIKARAETVTLMGVLSTGTTLAGLKIRSINAANLVEFTAAGTALTGTGAGDPLPLSAAQVLTFRTAFAGRSFRGRIYFSGFTEGQNDTTGRIAQAASDAAVGFMTGVAAVFVANGFQLAVLSRPVAARTIPARTIAAKSGFANNVTLTQSRNLKWESQRRRTGKT